MNSEFKCLLDAFDQFWTWAYIMTTRNYELSKVKSIRVIYGKAASLDVSLLLLSKKSLLHHGWPILGPYWCRSHVFSCWTLKTEAVMASCWFLLFEHKSDYWNYFKSLIEQLTVRMVRVSVTCQDLTREISLQCSELWLDESAALVGVWCNYVMLEYLQHQRRDSLWKWTWAVKSMQTGSQPSFDSSWPRYVSLTSCTLFLTPYFHLLSVLLPQGSPTSCCSSQLASSLSLPVPRIKWRVTVCSCAFCPQTAS